MNSMKLNPKKFQFMILSKNRCPQYNLLTDSNLIKETAVVELPRLITDNKLCFEKRISKLCYTGHTNSIYSGEKLGS